MKNKIKQIILSIKPISSQQYLQWLFISPELRKYRYTPQQQRRFQRHADRKTKSFFYKMRLLRTIQAIKNALFVKPRNWFRQPMDIIWREEYGEETMFPFCPRCNEYAYKKDRCVFCGQPFKK